MRACLATLLLMLAGCAEAQPLVLHFDKGVCSGTAVGRDVVLTASHCFADGSRLVGINGQPAYALERIADGKDHELVRVTARFADWSARRADPKVGERVTWVGAPMGIWPVARQGYVSRITDEVWVLAEGFHGDSGAGIFNADGRLVGVVSGIRVWQTPQGSRFQAMVAFPLAFKAMDWQEIKE